jgi:nucleoporin SEH1
VRPGFLHNLTPSRLPSQAASDSSLSPSDPPHSVRSARASFGQHQQQSQTSNPLQLPHSNLNLIVSSHHVLDRIDLLAPLIQDPPADEDDDDSAIASSDSRVRTHLETAFLSAHRAFANMAAERSFQSFSHRHQDLVLAVDFNYFGTRMVTAGSDHRLKVWDKKDDSWTLVESWKAHDAEIVDVSKLCDRVSVWSSVAAFAGVSVPRHVHARFATLVLRAQHR